MSINSSKLAPKLAITKVEMNIFCVKLFDCLMRAETCCQNSIKYVLTAVLCRKKLKLLSVIDLETLIQNMLL